MPFVLRLFFLLLFLEGSAGAGFSQEAQQPSRRAPMPGLDIGPPMVCGGKDEVTVTINGPASNTATLLIQTGDDSAHESHMCVICISIGSPGVPKRGDCNVSMSDGEWGRLFSIRIEGFSPDGRHILGLSSEGGKGPVVTEVFDFDSQLGPNPTYKADIAPYLKRLRRAKCDTSIEVAGTTKDGLIVLEPTATDPCRAKYRAILDVKTAKLKGFPLAQSFNPLYPARTP